MAPAHVYRQISATFASFLQSVTTGIIMGFTAVLLPQLEMDEYFTYDKNFDSWIAAISPLAMSIGGLFSGGLSDLIGRKMGQIILIIPSIIGWIIMGVSGNNLLMLIGRFVTGICAGASRSSTLVYVGEVTDPKYRPVALITYSTGIQFGTLMAVTRIQFHTLLELRNVFSAPARPKMLAKLLNPVVTTGQEDRELGEPLAELLDALVQ
ncbi:unnamed protein product [Arctia plantaginis]|uniref:Major facilitator superfamily (MFS) profile domain-containing protein n=1 Tax=Arctia plantaginis TaxID=874455 RepID=A0A8S1A8C2_ARCPL|nr:unnamed protein product [Arctia plantaginis]